MATMPNEENLFNQIKALANEINCRILGVLIAHKPDPVPVRIISEEAGYKRTTTSVHLSQLHKAQLIAAQGRRRGYAADTGEIRAIVGPRIYARITQDLRGQNEDTPGQS